MDASAFLRLLGSPGAGLSALADAPQTVGLSALAADPMGDATAALEARRRQQVTDAGYPGAAADATNPFEGVLSALGPTINERAVAAREAMRRGDMATANALNQSLALDFGQFLGSIKPIRAYHGSPHDFDRFDISKIGTGEGAQAYGHGLYFTQTEDVAKHYRDSLSREYAGGELAANISGKQILNPNSIQYEFARAGGDISAARRALEENDWRYLRENLRTRGAGEADLTASIMARKIQELESLRGKLARLEKPGRMYEVDIHADPSRFLDWDAPLSGQPREFSAAIHEFERNMGGPQSKMRLGDAMRTDSSLEDLAREAGIPGIKYLDRGSRMSGDGSRNYVVFDDKLIEILRKYGIMAPVAGAGLSALYLDGEEGM